MAEKPIRDWAFELHTDADEPRTGVIEARTKEEARKRILAAVKKSVKVQKLELTLR